MGLGELNDMINFCGIDVPKKKKKPETFRFRVVLYKDSCVDAIYEVDRALHWKRDKTTGKMGKCILLNGKYLFLKERDNKEYTVRFMIP